MPRTHPTLRAIVAALFATALAWTTMSVGGAAHASSGHQHRHHHHHRVHHRAHHRVHHRARHHQVGHTSHTSQSSSQSCTPGYSPCLPPASDYDCAGGSGNGPKYVDGPVYVTGSDPYGLDSDGDGIGCE